MGSRAVVIKQSKKLLPSCIADGLSVNYGSFVSNTESDLVAITFPNLNEFVQDIDTTGSFDYTETISVLSRRHLERFRGWRSPM